MRKKWRVAAALAAVTVVTGCTVTVGGSASPVPGQGRARALRYPLVFGEECAVEVRRDEPEAHAAPTGSSTSRPPRNGRSGSGTRTDPSAC